MTTDNRTNEPTPEQVREKLREAVRYETGGDIRVPVAHIKALLSGGAPSEEQIERAAVAMQAESAGFFSTEAWRHLARVGLTAAGVAQQEPTEAMVLAAAKALAGGEKLFWAYPNNDQDRATYRAEARAALVAAQGVALQDPERIMLHYPDGTPKSNDKIRAEAAAMREGAAPQVIVCDYCGDALPSVASREHIPTTPSIQRLGFSADKVVCPECVQRAKCAAPVLPSSDVDEDALAEAIEEARREWRMEWIVMQEREEPVPTPPGEWTARAVAEWLKASSTRKGGK